MFAPHGFSPNNGVKFNVRKKCLWLTLYYINIINYCVIKRYSFCWSLLIYGIVSSWGWDIQIYCRENMTIKMLHWNFKSSKIKWTINWQDINKLASASSFMLQNNGYIHRQTVTFIHVYSVDIITSLLWTDCIACWGKFVICHIGLHKINWIELLLCCSCQHCCCAEVFVLLIKRSCLWRGICSPADSLLLLRLFESIQNLTVYSFYIYSHYIHVLYVSTTVVNSSW